MEFTNGKWVPLEVFARKKGLSKSTAYKLINKGELAKRMAPQGLEIFVAPKDAASFEDDDPPIKKGADVMDVDLKLLDGDDYGIASQSLQTVLAMHKEVLAEKHRMLSEWEAELVRREDKLNALEAALADRDQKIADKTTENRHLLRRVQIAEETSQRLQKEIEETRETLKQLDQLTDGSEKDWNGLQALLNDKDRIIETKDEIIASLQISTAQKDDVLQRTETLINELRKSIEETNSLLKEKEQIIHMHEMSPMDLEGKLQAKDQTIAELHTLIRSLEQQVETVSKAHDLTGFTEEKGQTTELIQDQLQFLMAAADYNKYLEDNNAIPQDESDSTDEIVQE